MRRTKYLLIGGGLSCASAARAIRQADSSGSVMLVSREVHLPYHRPPLSKEYMQGRKADSVVFIEPSEFYRVNNVELVPGQAVERLDLARKVATLTQGDEIEFDKALLGMGGQPIKLPLEGSDLPGVHYFRTLDDAIEVSRRARPSDRAVIIGGGFIGVELASSLTQRGMSVTLINRSSHLWSRFADKRLADYVEHYCQQRGVSFMMGQQASSIQGPHRARAVALASGQSVPCELAVIAVGIEPSVELARQAGLQINNGVLVNEYMQTSQADMYAAGDLANYPDPFFHIRRRVEHWGQAEYTGSLAGANMAGGNEKKYDLLTYIWSDIFDLHLEFAGEEHDYDKVILRGEMARDSFSLLQLRLGHLRAYYAVNVAKEEYKKLAQLIERRVDLVGHEEQLRNAGFDLDELLKTPATT